MTKKPTITLNLSQTRTSDDKTMVGFALKNTKTGKVEAFCGSLNNEVPTSIIQHWVDLVITSPRRYIITTFTYGLEENA